MVLKFRVGPCGSGRVGLVLMEGSIKTGFYGGFAFAWPYAIEVEEGASVPGARQADEEERQTRQPL